MPFTYDRDDAHRRIRVTWLGAMTVPEVIQVQDQQLGDDAWTYGSVVDVRDGGFDEAGAQALFANVQQRVANHGPMGPVALIATDRATLRLMQHFSVLYLRAGLELQVFLDIRDAERWVDSRRRL